MRTRKEIIYLNIDDLTEEEIIALGDMGLNCCDNCGEIDLSENLHWIEGEDYREDVNCQSLLASGMVALCHKCYDVMNTRIAQCGSCENYFIVHKEGMDCVHCGSCNWVYGCIDEPEPDWSPDKDKPI